MALDARELAGDFGELLMNVVTMVNSVTIAIASPSSSQPPPYLGEKSSTPTNVILLRYLRLVLIELY